MIQLTALPVPGVFDPAPTAGLFTASTSDFAIALADLAGAPPVAEPAATVPPEIEAAPGIVIAFRQPPAAPGKSLPPGNLREAALAPSGRGLAPARVAAAPLPPVPTDQPTAAPGSKVASEAEPALTTGDPWSVAAPAAHTLPPQPIAAVELSPVRDQATLPASVSVPAAADRPQSKALEREPLPHSREAFAAIAPAAAGPGAFVATPTSAAPALTSEPASHTSAHTTSTLSVPPRPELGARTTEHESSPPIVTPPTGRHAARPDPSSRRAQPPAAQASERPASGHEGGASSFATGSRSATPDIELGLAPQRPEVAPIPADAPVTVRDVPQLSPEASTTRVREPGQHVRSAGEPPAIQAVAALPPSITPAVDHAPEAAWRAEAMPALPSRAVQAPRSIASREAEPRAVTPITVGGETAASGAPHANSNQSLAPSRATERFSGADPTSRNSGAPLISASAALPTATVVAAPPQHAMRERPALSATFVRPVVSASPVVRPAAPVIVQQPTVPARFAVAGAASMEPTASGLDAPIAATPIAKPAPIAAAAAPPAAAGAIPTQAVPLPRDVPPAPEARAGPINAPQQLTDVGTSHPHGEAASELPVAAPSPDRTSSTLAAALKRVADALPSVADQPGRPSRPFAAPPAPIVTPTQPAVQAFAAAIFAAADRPAARLFESTDLSSSFPVSALAAAAPPIAAQPVVDPRAPALDLRGDTWMGEMIETIEQLRDAAGPASAGATETRLRLAPDALGKVDVAIRQEDGQLSVQITAETAAARTILAEAAPRLAELAEARGLKLGAHGAEAGTSGSLADRHQRQQQQQSNQPARPASAQRDEDRPAGTPRTRIA